MFSQSRLRRNSTVILKMYMKYIMSLMLKIGWHSEIIIRPERNRSCVRGLLFLLHGCRIWLLERRKICLFLICDGENQFENVKLYLLYSRNKR